MKHPLPRGWNEVKLKDIGEIFGGGTPSTANKEYWNGDILWLTPAEVTALKTKYLYDTERKITELGLKNSSAKMIKPNSLIICTRATIGDCCINKKEISTNQGFKSITPNNNYDVVFLYYLINYNRNLLIANSSGSTFLEISKSNLENLSFYFPPLDEQKRIADILSTFDDLIENLTKLIEKKEIYKKGVMQRVLTGKVRFNGFKDEWKTVRLGDIATFETGTSKSKYIDDNGKYIIIDMGAVSEKGKIIANKKTNFNQEFIKKNSLIMPKDDIGNGRIIGKTAVIDIDNLYVLGDHVFQLTIKNNNPYFISYCINSHDNNKQIRRLCAGSMQIGLSKKSIENVRIKIPPSIEEQKKIGELLTLIDKDIEILKQILHLRKLQKKGVMQKLLTGEVRV